MTWLRFKTLTLRLNIVFLALGWLAFWGYGVVVGDVPPLSVVPGLVLLSILLSLGVTLTGFAVCHTWLFLRAKRARALPAFTKRDIQALTAGAFGVFSLVLVALVGEFGRGVPDAVAVPVGIIGGAAAVIGVLYGALAAGSQYFRWHFTS